MRIGQSKSMIPAAFEILRIPVKRKITYSLWLSQVFVDVRKSIDVVICNFEGSDYML